MTKERMIEVKVEAVRRKMSVASLMSANRLVSLGLEYVARRNR